ncbi:MAG: hydrolase [Methylococcaceae bacterium]|nr:hydrolase [Methylococcaceae bacterium]
MQSYIFLDLDDTLFQTLRKCALGADDPDLQVRAYLPDGSANSFATRKQQWLWDWLAKGFKVVPVTARDFQAFQRVHLPFQEEVVLNHGAVILDKQRVVDRAWVDSLVQELPAYTAQLVAVWAEVEAYAKQYPGFKLRLVRDFDVTWYGVIKHGSGQEAPLQALLNAVVKPFAGIADGSLYWHLNGNNLAILPRIINKEAAVRYLLEGYRRVHPEMLTFGAGDSHTDAAFMALCDYALIPKNTQLFSALAVAKGLV